MALPRGTDVEYLGTNASGGMCVGSDATELVSFHGSTPTDQYAAITSVSTSAAVSVCGVFAFTSAQANGIITALNSVLALLNEKGLSA